MHYFGFEELADVEDLMRVVHPDEDLQGSKQCFPHATLTQGEKSECLMDTRTSAGGIRGAVTCPPLTKTVPVQFIKTDNWVELMV